MSLCPPDQFLSSTPSPASHLLGLLLRLVQFALLQFYLPPAVLCCCFDSKHLDQHQPRTGRVSPLSRSFSISSTCLSPHSFCGFAWVNVLDLSSLGPQPLTLFWPLISFILIFFSFITISLFFPLVVRYLLSQLVPPASYQRDSNSNGHTGWLVPLLLAQTTSP
jgi:hypothetical protein